MSCCCRCTYPRSPCAAIQTSGPSAVLFCSPTWGPSPTVCIHGCPLWVSDATLPEWDSCSQPRSQTSNTPAWDTPSGPSCVPDSLTASTASICCLPHDGLGLRGSVSQLRGHLWLYHRLLHANSCGIPGTPFSLASCGPETLSGATLGPLAECTPSSWRGPTNVRCVALHNFRALFLPGTLDTNSTGLVRPAARHQECYVWIWWVS